MDQTDVFSGEVGGQSVNGRNYFETMILKVKAALLQSLTAQRC